MYGSKARLLVSQCHRLYSSPAEFTMLSRMLCYPSSTCGSQTLLCPIYQTRERISMETTFCVICSCDSFQTICSPSETLGQHCVHYFVFCTLRPSSGQAEKDKFKNIYLQPFFLKQSDGLKAVAYHFTKDEISPNRQGQAGLLKKSLLRTETF